MSTQALELLIKPESDETTRRMVSALQRGFPLSADLEKAVCADQHCTTLDEAMQRWLHDMLLFPEQPFAAVLMPLIVERFAAYLDHLRRKQPWII